LHATRWRRSVRSEYRYPKAIWPAANIANISNSASYKSRHSSPVLPPPIIATHHVTTKQYRTFHNYSSSSYSAVCLQSAKLCIFPLRTRKDWRIKFIWEGIIYTGFRAERRKRGVGGLGGWGGGAMKGTGGQLTRTFLKFL
jgi:hypothetical protein